MRRTVRNPLRVLGIARCLVGAGFVASAARTWRDRGFLLEQAARLFRGDLGATDAPIRATLMLAIAVALLLLGIVTMARGLRWMRGLVAAGTGPAALSAQEVVEVLVERRLPAYATSDAASSSLLQRVAGDELARLTRWRRALIEDATRAVRWATGLAILLPIPWIAVRLVTREPLLGAFPIWFAILLPFLAAVWVGLLLLQLGATPPRLESVDLPHSGRRDAGGSAPAFTEDRPTLLTWEPAALGNTIGLLGVLTQCLLLSWWTLGTLGYPHLATSIVRHLASIVAGAIFFALGDRMLAAARELLVRVQYDSIVVLVVDTGSGWVARAAEIRTEAREPSGPRQVITAVGGAHTRSAAPRLVPP